MTDYTSQPATFRVDKYQAYEDGKVLFEQYTILMYGSDKLCCTRTYSGAYPFTFRQLIRV